MIIKIFILFLVVYIVYIFNQLCSIAVSTSDIAKSTADIANSLKKKQMQELSDFINEDCCKVCQDGLCSECCVYSIQEKIRRM